MISNNQFGIPQKSFSVISFNIAGALSSVDLPFKQKTRQATIILILKKLIFYHNISKFTLLMLFG
jgi:hypothetical protein